MRTPSPPWAWMLIATLVVTNIVALTIRLPMDYVTAPGYRDELEALDIPAHYSVEDSLRLVAHGFDPNVRCVLASRLARNMEARGDSQKILAPFLSATDPAIAWAAGWTAEKCGIDLDYESVYRRDDVLAFERTHHIGDW